MNPKIKKTQDELERTKAKIIELQALVPQLERSITDMENTEIIRLFRSANISLTELPALIASIKQAAAVVSSEAQNSDYTGGNDSLNLNEEGDDYV